MQEEKQPDTATNGITMDDTDQLAPGKKRMLWSKLKKKWNRKGLIEIEDTHAHFEKLECLRECLRTVLLEHPELGPQDEVEASHFTSVFSTQMTAPSGKVYELRSYASPVFATLRRALGIKEQHFCQSVAPKLLPYLEFLSNSHGGQNFFLSNDKAYFMKTEKKQYIDYFLGILGEYLEHFLKCPHSLLVKFLGVYSLSLVQGEPGKGEAGQSFICVMQSIFYPEERIDVRYDLKGCLANRYQKETKSDDIVVYKDQNFVNIGEILDLGYEREWFLQQLEYDVDFLRGLGVLDYSLLVGKYPLHQDEKKANLPGFVSRIRKSIAPTTKAEDAAEIFQQNLAKSENMEMKEMAEIEEEGQLSKQEDNREAGKQRPQVRRKNISFVDPDILDTTDAVNRRLLPDTKNPLHIIDGPVYRYHVGIIDFFTQYECRQRTGRFLKSVKHCCGDHSTLPPQSYAERFKRFIIEHTT